jgi:hypothetical protein
MEKETIRFGEFQIHRPSESDIVKLLGGHAQPLFYPWAYLNAKDLAGYWLLIAREEAPLDAPGACT